MTLAVAIVTAMVTVWLAHRRFRADQCWLARREAYSAVLKYLLEYKTICDDSRREIEKNGLPEDASRSKLAVEGKEALSRFQMAAVADGFFFTDKARKAMDAFIDSYEEQIKAARLAQARPGYLAIQDVPARLKALSDAAVSVMTAIRKIAKADLGIK